VQFYKVLSSSLFFVSFILPSIANALEKLNGCAGALSSAMIQLKGSEKTFSVLVEEKAKGVQSVLRSAVELRVASEDALDAIHLAFSMQEVDVASFIFPSPIPKFLWSEQQSSLLRLQEFFHGQVEFTELSGADFSVHFRVPSGPIGSVFFENITKQVFDMHTERLTYALKAFEVLKKVRTGSRYYYKVEYNKLIRDITHEYLEVLKRMPSLSTLALQFYRLAKAKEEGDLLPLEEVKLLEFETYLEKDTSYRLAAHSYLSLRRILNQFGQDPDISRRVAELQSRSNP